LRIFSFAFFLLKLLLKAFGWLFIALIFVIFCEYIISERYTFPEPQPFSGPVWYNPYDKMDSLHWRRTNLHMHSHAWGGFTNGSGNDNHEVWDLYKRLGYESIGISNYQYIDTLFSNEPFYIPVYEHGYGLFKSHQLCIGAKKVVWYDLPFGQNVHHKQYILNRLHEHCEMLSINHPAFFGGYSTHDFKYLSNYDLLEALNGYRNSIPYWDTALSAGKPAFLMANDDMHDLSSPGEVSRRFMVVNSPDNKRESILSALKKGNAYGVHILMPLDETFEGKLARFDTLPEVREVSVNGDTLSISLSTKALEIRFFGQNGKLLSKKAGSKHASYIMKPEDTYVRAVAIYTTPNDPEGITLYLNPVFRTPDGNKPMMIPARYDAWATWIYRIIAVATLAFVIANIVILRRRYKSWKKNRK